jgi:hypothetical protein
MASSGDREIDRKITNNLHHLSKYGVLTARPRFEIADHQLTGRRAIVATVHTKKPLAGLHHGEAISEDIGGEPVDVQEANAYQGLRANDPLAAEISQTYRRPEDAEPEWALERELPSGQLLTSARSETQKKLAAQRKAQPASDRALIAQDIAQYFGLIFSADWQDSRPPVASRARPERREQRKLASKKTAKRRT